MMSDATPFHSDEEVLAAFLDGQLEGEELNEVRNHLAECEECRMTIADGAMFQQEEEKQQLRSRRRWWAAAAAVAIAVLTLPAYRWHRQQQKNEADAKLQTLYAAMTEKGRPIDGRFSGQMVYAKHIVNRGGGEEREPLPLGLMAAASDIEATYEKDTSPLAAHAKALALAATEPHSSNALAILEQVPTSKRDAAVWNDLAALKLARSQAEWEHPQLAAATLNEALKAADHALQLEPGKREALFNRAMILKKMHDPSAAQAIKDYVAVDPQSQWADEVKNSQ